MSGEYVVGKEHIGGRQFCAVVIEKQRWRVVYRAPLNNWTKAAKAQCAAWIEAKSR